MQVYKNFLEEKDIEDISAILRSDIFPWFFNYVVNKEDLNPKATQNFHFTHRFYSDFGSRSNFFDILTPVFKKINPLCILRVKANLLTKSSKIIEHGMHVDFTNPYVKINTGILYINTNNGYTKFKDGKKIKSIKNQYVEFDSKLEHTGSTCTDEDRRIVINFNYIKK